MKRDCRRRLVCSGTKERKKEALERGNEEKQCLDHHDRDLPRDVAIRKVKTVHANTDPRA